MRKMYDDIRCENCAYYDDSYGASDCKFNPPFLNLNTNSFLVPSVSKDSFCHNFEKLKYFKYQPKTDLSTVIKPKAPQ